MPGDKSLAGGSSLFFRREVWKVLTTLSQLSASHIKRFWGSDKCGAALRLIDDFPACFCMGRCLCLEPILPVAALWRSTCKPYCKAGSKKKKDIHSWGGCLTGGSEPSRAAARFWFIRSDPTHRLWKAFFQPLFCLTVLLSKWKGDLSSVMRKRVKGHLGGSETLFRPFHVFNFHSLLYDNGRGQLKEKNDPTPTSIGCIGQF